MRRAVATVVEAAEPGPDAVGTRRSIIIERIAPELDCGRYPVKRVVGDQLLVTADIFADGHDLLDAAILIRADDESDWRRAPMRPIDNDRVEVPAIAEQLHVPGPAVVVDRSQRS